MGVGDEQNVIGFAHRGAALTKREENTLPAFERALSLGADGIETDIGLTADGVPVLLHTGISLRRSFSVSRLPRHELPAHIPSLADLYARCGHHFELSLDMAQPLAAEAVIRVAEELEAVDRLWLTYWRLPALEAWRRRWPQVHLVYPTLSLRSGSFVRLVTQLAAIEVDAVNVFHRLCTAHMVELAHGHGLRIFVWGVRSRRPLERVVARGVDGVYCDDVEAMVSVLGSRT